MKVTQKGQVTLPKKLRDKYGITQATEVEFIDRNGDIVLMKRTAAGSLARFRGIANRKGIPRRTDEFLRLIREG